MPPGAAAECGAGERLGERLTVLKSGPATFEQFYGHVAGRFADQAPAFERASAELRTQVRESDELQ